jgi:hypothetical protein
MDKMLKMYDFKNKRVRKTNEASSSPPINNSK